MQTSLAVCVSVTVALACMALMPWSAAAAAEVVQAEGIEAKAAAAYMCEGRRDCSGAVL